MVEAYLATIEGVDVHVLWEIWQTSQWPAEEILAGTLEKLNIHKPVFPEKEACELMLGVSLIYFNSWYLLGSGS